MKKCNRCSETKPDYEFIGKLRNGKRGKSMRQYCDACADYRKNDRLKNAERNKEYERYTKRKLRDEILQAYGNKCQCCGESRKEFLCIDHVNGGGRQERLKMSSLSTYYRQIKTNGFPPKYRILCHNCNFARGRYGYCPHETERVNILGIVKGLGQTGLEYDRER